MNTKINSKLAEPALIIAVILIFIVLQVPTISNPSWEKYDGWRQGDTYSIALNFYQYEYNILKPQFNYDGPANNYVQLEFQIMPFMAATAFKILNKTTPLIPRALSLLFFLGSAIYLYFIMRKFTGVTASVCGLAIYLFMPINRLYSRAIMPEAAALFFLCGGVYYLLEWYLDGKPLHIWLSALFTAVAITQKTPVIFAGILVLCIFIWRLKSGIIRSVTFYGYGLISLGIPAAYYIYASNIAVFKFVDGISAKHIFTDKIFSIFTKKGLDFFGTNLPLFFGWTLIIFAVIGLLLTFSKERRFILVWALAFILEWVTIAAVIKLGYYLIFMSPVFAVLSAVAVSDLWKWKRQIAVIGTAAAVCITVYSGVRRSKELIQIREDVGTTAALIQKYTESDDIIAITGTDPSYLNAANRRGYRANIKYYDYIPREPEGEVKYFIDHGVSCFVLLEGSIPPGDSGYIDYLRTNYSVIDSDGFCTLFKLE